MNRWFKLAGVTAGVTLGLGTLVAFSEVGETAAPLETEETVTVTVTVSEDAGYDTEIGAGVVTDAPEEEKLETVEETVPSVTPATIPDVEVPVEEASVTETAIAPDLPADMDLGTLKCGADAKPAIDYNEDWGWWAYCEPALVD